MGVYLTDLADACRTSCLPVVEEEGWRSRGHGPLSGQPRALVVHHTAGPSAGEVPSLRVVRDGRSDLLGPLAHLVLGRSGTVYVVAAGLAYHAGVVWSPDTQGNAWTIGIEAEHDGRSPWPPAQYEAYVRLCAALCRWYGLGPDRVLGHKEVAKPTGRKVDPTFDMTEFRSAVSHAMTPPQTTAEPRNHGGDPMYIKCESVKPGGPIWTGLLSGGVLIGPLSPGEVQSAEVNIREKGVPVQWVERSTWDFLEDRSRPVRAA